MQDSSEDHRPFVPPEGYDSEEQTAAEFGVTKRSLKRWRALRRGPPVTYFGRKPAYNRESKRRYLASREGKGMWCGKAKTAR